MSTDLPQFDNHVLLGLGVTYQLLKPLVPALYPADSKRMVRYKFS